MGTSPSTGPDLTSQLPLYMGLNIINLKKLHYYDVFRHFAWLAIIVSTFSRINEFLEIASLARGLW